MQVAQRTIGRAAKRISVTFKKVEPDQGEPTVVCGERRDARVMPRLPRGVIESNAAQW